MSLMRVLRTSSVALSRVFYVDETPTDASGDVSVVVKRLDGTTIQTVPVATHGQTGVYQFVLNPVATVDALTVDWSGTFSGSALVPRDIVEIVGGFIFGIAEARASDPQLADTQRYPTPLLIQKRIEVEQECERICGHAFVPRYTRMLVDGSGWSDIMAKDVDLRVLMSAKVAPRTGGSFVALTGDQVAAVAMKKTGVLIRGDGARWTRGFDNVLLEYEYGFDMPPDDLKLAAMQRLRSRVTMTRSAIPDRAISFTSGEGGTYRISMPSGDRTGIPDIDGVYEGYSLARGAGGVA